MGTRMRKEQRERAEREERREREAINSTRLQMDLVKTAALRFLEGEGLVADAANNSDDATGDHQDSFLTAVEQLLVGIYRADVGIDAEANQCAVDSCEMLDRWRDWVERGGMTKEDLRAILRDKHAFCWAAVAMGLVTKVIGEERTDGGGLLNDVRECLRVWKKGRLG